MTFAIAQETSNQTTTPCFFFLNNLSQPHLRKPWPLPIESFRVTCRRLTSVSGTSETSKDVTLFGTNCERVYFCLSVPCVVPMAYMPSLPTSVMTPKTFLNSPRPRSTSGMGTDTFPPTSRGLKRVAVTDNILFACFSCLLRARFLSLTIFFSGMIGKQLLTSLHPSRQ